MNNIPVIDVSHGIANNFGNRIEINKHLRDYPHLLKPILEHEFAHTNKPVSWEDFRLDFLTTNAVHYRDLFFFMVKHPRSFTQFLPFYWTPKKGFVYDFNLMVMYITFASIITTTIYFGGKYL